jgi:TonB family protein
MLPAPNEASASAPARVLKSITVTGLSDQAKADFLARLPVHEGDTLTPDVVKQAILAMKEFDEHLSLSAYANNGAADWRIGPESAQEPVKALAGPVIRVGGNIQAVNLVSKVTPAYPALAKQARVQGTVRLEATIGKDGTVQDLQVMSGHPLLAQAALDAVKNWVYRPTLLNGDPVVVKTTIDVNFTLEQ